MPRLRVKRIDTVGFVDKGDDPEAVVAFWKKRMEEHPMAKGDLMRAVEELGGRIRRRQDPRGDSTRRAYAAERTLSAERDVVALIERLATDDPLYKVVPSGEGDRSWVREGIEREVQKRAEVLMDQHPGLSLVEARAQAWREDADRLELYHRPGVEQPGMAGLQAVALGRSRVDYDRAVAELSRLLAPGDPDLGLKLVAKHFPKLSARWRGMPR